MQCGLKSQLAYIYIYIYVSVQLPSRLGMQLNLRLHSLYVNASAPGGQARVQNGFLTSYMDAAFVLLAHKGSEIWTNRSLLLPR